MTAFAIDSARAASARRRVATPGRVIAIVLAFWTIYGGFFTLQFYTTFSNTYRQMTWQLAFGSQMIAAYIWAAGTFVAIWSSRRWPIERHNLGRRLLLHVLISLAFTIVFGGIHALVDMLFFRTQILKVSVLRAMVFMADREINTYCAVLFITHSYNYYCRANDVEVRAAQLQSELANAKLDLLRAQIHPHFLFNTLNTISSILREDPDGADRMISSLGQFLRAALEQSRTAEVPLKQELDLLSAYLSIQKVRFEDALHIEIDVQPDVLDALVPILVLQPLAENAIKHGLRDETENLTLTIRARRDGDTLHMQVHDSGGSGGNDRPGLGVGLANTRQRLLHTYGERQSVTIEQTPGEGFGVTLRVPLREAERRGAPR